jgi:hypothetical protein
MVYCTGRSMRGRPSPYNRRETIEETAESVNAAGGSAIALRVDQTVEAEVEALFAGCNAQVRLVCRVIENVFTRTLRH